MGPVLYPRMARFCLSHHLPALVGARPAGFGADAAVLHVLVLIALGTAGVADVGAHPAQVLRVLAVPGHVLARQCAYVSTIAV